MSKLSVPYPLLSGRDQGHAIDWAKIIPYLDTIFVSILAGAVRLTDLGVFRAIDEEDRWN